MRQPQDKVLQAFSLEIHVPKIAIKSLKGLKLKAQSLGHRPKTGIDIELFSLKG